MKATLLEKIRKYNDGITELYGCLSRDLSNLEKDVENGILTLYDDTWYTHIDYNTPGCRMVYTVEKGEEVGSVVDLTPTPTDKNAWDGWGVDDWLPGMPIR